MKTKGKMFWTLVVLGLVNLFAGSCFVMELYRDMEPAMKRSHDNPDWPEH